LCITGSICVRLRLEARTYQFKRKLNRMEKVSNKHQTATDVYTVLPTVFDSVADAVKKLKLDKRHKWEEFCGELVYPYKYSHACSGCAEQKEMQQTPQKGCGCHECGYTGRKRDVVPVPAFMPDGSIVKVRSSNGG